MKDVEDVEDVEDVDVRCPCQCPAAQGGQLWVHGVPSCWELKMRLTCSRTSSTAMTHLSEPMQIQRVNVSGYKTGRFFQQVPNWQK